MQIFVRAAYAGAVLALNVRPSDCTSDVAARYAHECGRVAQTTDEMRLVHQGSTMAGGCTLEAAGLGPGSTLELLPRVLGGGGDGGSTGAESRSSYLEMYMGKKPDKVNPEEERLARWTTCHLSGEPLQPPCVCDELGSVYNKDAVIQALVGKTMPKSLAHISSLKHLLDIRLERAHGAAPGAAVQFACPVTGLPMNGKGRFVVVRRGGQGHVVGEKALKEVPAVVKEIVGGEWAAEEVLPVNPQGEELAQLTAALEAKREVERAAKREKKASKAGGKRGAAEAAVSAAPALGVNGGVGVGPQAAAPIGADALTTKKARNTAAELMPAHADKAVWNSLFTSSKQGQGKGTGDYMLRGGHRLA